MQDVQEHSSESELNNGAIQCKLQSVKLTGNGLFEMLNEAYLSQLNRKTFVCDKLTQQGLNFQLSVQTLWH